MYRYHAVPASFETAETRPSVGLPRQQTEFKIKEHPVDRLLLYMLLHKTI